MLLRWRRVLAWALAAMLVACGGGGGGGGSGNSIQLDRTTVEFLLGTADRDVSQVVVGVTFKGAGVVVATLPGESPPPWLFVTAGAPTAGTASVTIQAVQSGLAPGRYVTTLRFATGNADLSGVVTQDLLVALSIPARVSPSAFDVDTAVGAVPTAQTLAVDAGAWTVQADQPWISLDRTEGTGAGSVVVSVAPGARGVGSYSGNVVVTETGSGVTQILPVRMALDPRRLLVRRPTVTLSQYANRATLSGAIVVTDTGNAVTRWSASADQPWLQLSASQGQTPDGLTVTADAAGLADGLHLARVTIAPRGEPDVANSVVVRVAFAVNRGLVVAPLVALPANEGVCVAGENWLRDPLRNRFYFARCGDTLDVYDADSGALVTSRVVPGAVLNSLAVSLDGSTLFAVDTSHAVVQRIDLDTFALGSPITPARLNGATRLTYTDVQGQPVLVTNEFEFFDAASGARLADASNLYSGACCGLRLAARRDGRALYAVNSTAANHDLMRFSLAWRGGALLVKLTHLFNEPGTGNGLALDEADTRLVSAVDSTIAFGGPFAGQLLAAFVRDPTTMVETAWLPLLEGNGASQVVAVGSARTWIAYRNGVAAFDSAQLQVGRYSFGDSMGFGLLSADASRMMIIASQAAQGFVQFIDAP